MPAPVIERTQLKHLVTKRLHEMGLTMSEMSRRMGRSHGYISNLLRGRYTGHHVALIKMARLLNLDENEFLLIALSTEPDDATVSELKTLCKQIPAHRRKEARAFLLGLIEVGSEHPE